MKKVEKDLSKVPDSLNSKLTVKRRNELISKGEWSKDRVYQSRYKQNDVRESLELIYNHKCAYCEQRIESYHIEHFRAKSVYYWLAYSWDNLMLCCPKCNEIKNDSFTVKKRATIDSIDISDIHHLTNKYNEFEDNQLINPELDDVSGSVTFTKHGKIQSVDNKVNKTIEVCKLNRRKLIEFRKPIYDTFEKEILSRKDNKKELKKRIIEFINETKSPHTEFVLFRNYIEQKLIKEIL